MAFNYRMAGRAQPVMHRMAFVARSRRMWAPLLPNKQGFPTPETLCYGRSMNRKQDSHAGESNLVLGFSRIFTS
ncbi:hypothetical protein CHN51_12495 [Sphingorhabdus sp. YGSMI21]|nr:hypothetical protein CHN51_12495 [Sphingorhabdus sp. YGSMI21]